MADGSTEVLVFEVAGQRYGLPGKSVRELVRAVYVTSLPRQPEFVEGVINVRGQIVPVLDLRKWLRLPAKALEPSDHLLVASVNDRLVALRVDRALELAVVEMGVVDKAEGLSGKDEGIRVAKLPGGLVLIPDLQALLLPSASAGLEEVLASAPLTSGKEGRET